MWPDAVNFANRFSRRITCNTENQLLATITQLRSVRRRRGRPNQRAIRLSYNSPLIKSAPQNTGPAAHCWTTLFYSLSLAESTSPPARHSTTHCVQILYYKPTRLIGASISRRPASGKKRTEQKRGRESELGRLLYSKYHLAPTAHGAERGGANHASILIIHLERISTASRQPHQRRRYITRRTYSRPARLLTTGSSAAEYIVSKQASAFHPTT